MKVGEGEGESEEMELDELTEELYWLYFIMSIRLVEEAFRLRLDLAGIGGSLGRENSSSKLLFIFDLDFIANKLFEEELLSELVKNDAKSSASLSERTEMSETE